MQYGVQELFRRKRQQRGPKNTLDQSTIFSILPKYIRENKPTLEPNIFEMEAGHPDRPTKLTIGSSSWWREIDLDQPLLEIPASSIQVAESVVRDYINGIIMCDMGETRPGLFFLPGVVSVLELKEEHKDVLDLAVKRQENWFKALIKLADMLWARTNGNPVAIS